MINILKQKKMLFLLPLLHLCQLLFTSMPVILWTMSGAKSPMMAWKATNVPQSNPIMLKHNKEYGNYLWRGMGLRVANDPLPPHHCIIY